MTENCILCGHKLEDAYYFRHCSKMIANNWHYTIFCRDFDIKSKADSKMIGCDVTIFDEFKMKRSLFKTEIFKYDDFLWTSKPLLVFSKILSIEEFKNQSWKKLLMLK